MKLLIFSSYWHPYCSGALTLARDLAQHWAAQGHSVRVITFRYDARLPERDVEGGVEIVRLGGFLRVSKGFVAPLLLSRVWGAVRGADLLVLNLPAFEGLRPALAARLLGKPVVALVNCAVELGPGAIERLITAGLALSMRAQLALATRIVTWSEDYAAACPLLRRAGAKLRVIAPGLAPPPCDGAMLERLEAIIGAKRAVVFVGRVSREKGLEVLIAALERCADCDPILLLAGPHGEAVIGEEATQRRVERALARSGVPHVRLGFLTRAELGALYRRAAVLALPSLNRTESLGLVQAEALQLGARVVASDLPGVRQPVRQSGLGSLAAPGDVEGLAAALRTELGKPRPTPEECARAAVIFDPQTMHAAWDRLFDELR